MLIQYDYKKLNLKIKRFLIDKFLYKKIIEMTYYKRVKA